MKLSAAIILKSIHSKHFKTSFLLLFFLFHCFFIVSICLWANHFQTTAKEKVTFRLNTLLNRSEEILLSAKNNTLFAGTLPSVQNTLLSPNSSMDQLVVLSHDLTPLVDFMAYDSFTLYFSQSSLIYDSKAGLYSVADFYNPDLLTRFSQRNQEEYWEFAYPYQRYYDHKKPLVITYLHSLPLYQSETYGFIAVNIPLHNLGHYFASYYAEYQEQVYLYFQDKLLWSNTKDLALAQGKKLPDHKPTASPSLTLTSTSLPILKAEFTFPPFFMWQYFLTHLPIIIPLYLLLCLLNFIGALIYSAYYLNKLETFLCKIGMDEFRSFPSPPGKSQADSLYLNKLSLSKFKFSPKFDEFHLLNQAADHLQLEINNIKNTITNNKPLLQERLLTDILYHHIDVNAIPEKYADYDISFPYPYFCIILMAIQEIERVTTNTIKEEIKLVAKQNACQLFSSLGKVYSIYSEKENLLFLLNTSIDEDLQNQIYSVATALKKGMKESLGFHLLFSISFCDQNNPVPYYAWTKARKNLIFTSGSSDSFIIFSRQELYASSLMPSVIFQITQAIIDKDISRLGQVIEHFYDQNLPADTPMAQARKTILLAASSIFSALLEMDIIFSIDQINQMIGQVEKSKHIHQAKDLFFTFLISLIDHESKISSEAQEYIRQTLLYLESHFNESLTIPQIAENVNISPIYLNKIFKLSTGKTLSEYLNYYRTEKSKTLLLSTNMTINDISKALGYNDVRSYIRFFKKFYNITPNHFRKLEEE